MKNYQLPSIPSLFPIYHECKSGGREGRYLSPHSPRRGYSFSYLPFTLTLNLHIRGNTCKIPLFTHHSIQHKVERGGSKGHNLNNEFILLNKVCMIYLILHYPLKLVIYSRTLRVEGGEILLLRK